MIKLTNFSKAYENKEIFNNIDITFDKQGAIYTILGKSGTGKTTLFNILYGIDQEYVGNYFLDGKDARTLTSKE